MNDLRDRLVDAARRALVHSYAPYSHFPVAAALLDQDGEVHLGVNVENASLGLSICAERTAVFRAVADGRRRFRAVAVATPTAAPTAPCGACRQVLLEFGGPDLVVWLAGRGGDVAEHRLAELLPHAFDTYRQGDGS